VSDDHGGVDIRERCPVDDVALTMLHAAAFGETPRLRPWSAQLAGHSLTWLGAFDGDRMIGFANLAWDGGLHAFLLDVVVQPSRQRQGIGRTLVGAAVGLASGAGCAWLHADHAPDLAQFSQHCGLTSAGPTRLHTPGQRGV
jgi:GNAT superfamily N-acetyltransferase